MIRNFKSKIVRWLYPHGSIRSVLLGPNRGSRFIVVPGMGLTYGMGQDHWNFRFLSRFIRSNHTVYDVGANCGQMGLFFANQVGLKGRVLCFEPAPSNAETLRRVVELNRLSQAIVHEVAVASDNESRAFCFKPELHTFGGLEDTMASTEGWGKPLTVSCLSLDSLVEQGESPPDLIKIDVEGGGYEVVKGARLILQKHRPLIYLEAHAANDEAPELKALRELKTEHGYRIEHLNGHEMTELVACWGKPHWCVPERTAL